MLIEIIVSFITGLSVGLLFSYRKRVKEKREYISEIPEHVKNLDSEILEDLLMSVVREQALRGNIVKEFEDDDFRESLDHLRYLVEKSKKEKYLGELCKLILDTSPFPIWIDIYQRGSFITEYKNDTSLKIKINIDELNLKKLEAIENNEIVVFEKDSFKIKLVPFKYNHNLYIYGCVIYG